MPITDAEQADLDNRFAYHRADDTTAVKHESVRFVCLEAAKAIVSMCPPGREQALAVTRLEEAMFWANAAIARKHPVAPTGITATPGRS